ncbi:energy transducer TonB [Hymenobacter negativus]|uniref:Energy transducer TonB n=1 Tax=Hymenobacter negativus TaxID=2795026 RepID=A0ABS0Q8T2_9BACT|nr:MULTISPECIES: energy transducer TonB [Bacteria]MBH8559073.1 energy transducer TonB [Hymenobacter negativus]MBH8567461.1 energy transducer TonB [Hymenobacter negativus]MBR7207193.1 energy transducer TonB [Microvirga sp. STS02]
MLIAGLSAAASGLARAQTASADVPAQTDGGTAAPAAPTVYFTAEEMPAFPGGDAALAKFLVSKIKYPAAALDRSLSGKVHVTFTVDPAGHLHDPRVVRGLGSGLDEEALRLVRLMPWWTPGKVHGQPVWVSVTMPIVFRAL